MAEPLPEIMTIQETSIYLRISLSTLYKLAQGGRIPCQKVGRHWRFRRVALDRWLDQMPGTTDMVFEVDESRFVGE